MKSSWSKGKTAFLILLFLCTYMLFTFLFSSRMLISQKFSPEALLSGFFLLWQFKLIICMGITGIAALYGSGLNISAKTVGDGQYGDARWATEAEKRKAYLRVPFGKESLPGLVVGVEKNCWLVDTSDGTALMLAPPGGGKTTCVYVPTIYYNARVNANTGGQGASLMLTDSKGQLVHTTGKLLEDAGYRVLYLDFRNPLQSYAYNLMYNINQSIDCYKSATSSQDKILHYAAAERNAKILASSIVDNMDTTSKSDASQYFNETSKGLITALILLVSEYGEENERHIISVFKLIIELNGLDEGSTESLQKNKLNELLKSIDNDRIINFAGPSMKADVRTSMNIFSSALGKLVSFIDAELEQLVCGHSPELNSIDFIKQSTAIFLVCPDENTTRHFFASLFIRNMLNELIGQAEKNPSHQLTRPVLNLWDEWGNMPPIKDVDSLFTAARSRGVRSLVSVQSLRQMELRYNKTLTDVIKDSCQIVLFTFVSPLAGETAKLLSAALSDRTVRSGSVSRSEGKPSSTTFSMVKKPLMSPDEIIHLPFGRWVLMKAGCRPTKTRLNRYQDYLPALPDFRHHISAKIREIQYLTGEKIKRINERAAYRLQQGMFD